MTPNLQDHQHIKQI